MRAERDRRAAVATSTGGISGGARRGASAARESELSEPGAIVRRHDPDRFLIGLLMPAASREGAFAVAAFDRELARAVDVAAHGGGRAESVFAAKVRLQWWREVLDGARPRHPVAAALGLVLDRGILPAAVLAGLVDAREAELDGIDDEAGWHAALDGSAGNLARGFAHLAGLPADAVAWSGIAGAAYGAGVRLRGRDRSLARGRDTVPPGADPAALARSSLEALRAAGRCPVPRARRAPLLHAVLARRDLARVRDGHHALAREQGRGVGDRLAVIAAWFAGVG